MRRMGLIQSPDVRTPYMQGRLNPCNFWPFGSLGALENTSSETSMEKDGRILSVLIAVYAVPLNTGMSACTGLSRY